MMTSIAALGLAVTSLQGPGLEVVAVLRGGHAGLTPADVCRQLILEHEYAETAAPRVRSSGGRVGVPVSADVGSALCLRQCIANTGLGKGQVAELVEQQARAMPTAMCLARAGGDVSSAFALASQALNRVSRSVRAGAAGLP